MLDKIKVGGLAFLHYMGAGIAIVTIVTLILIAFCILVAVPIVLFSAGRWVIGIVYVALLVLPAVGFFAHVVEGE